MSSTEQKNVTQPFVNAAHTFGILPTIATGAFTNYGLDTSHEIYPELGRTIHLGDRLIKSDDPIDTAVNIMPNLSGAQPFTRVSPLLLQLCNDSKVFTGNMAVMRLTEAVLCGRWGLFFRDAGAIGQSSRHCHKIAAYLAPGSYGKTSRAHSGSHQLGHGGEGYKFRLASDTFDHLAAGPRFKDHHRKVRRWCSQARADLNSRSYYRTGKQAIIAFRELDLDALRKLSDPPAASQKWITTSRSSPIEVRLYNYGNTTFIKICHRNKTATKDTVQVSDGRRKGNRSSLKPITKNELFVLARRDLQDIAFLLHAASHVKLYHKRRLRDVDDARLGTRVATLQAQMWSMYIEVMSKCGDRFELRNKLGVYFDVLQWRYLARLSGDLFYNHSEIMAQKVVSKGLEDLPSQSALLYSLSLVPVDVAVDLLGMYKASVYPEVDPYQVVADQYRLHYSRHQTEWSDGSDEKIRFEDTKAYMWYFGVRVLYTQRRSWPGKIREGVEPKEWHRHYKTRGLPSDCWRDACDVDLTNAVVVADITDDQYMKQQDSACAPPLWNEYKDFEAMRQAPRRHRRKILYAIQEPDLPKLGDVMKELNMIGDQLPEGYVGKVEFNPGFSTDIVTGSRCERHKDAPRPFYAASPPWGCILSYVDGITRDFLKFVPQSMLGKSTRQKFMDMQAAQRLGEYDLQAFYMSDDKAKYSPRMDPQSQQLPADFFAELFGIPAIKAIGPVMYHNQLYYRVNGHLIHYGSNGTDREGMRGASNTWLEIVAQGLSTRLCREKNLIRGKSHFLSFIDDGLRKFSVETRRRDGRDSMDIAREVIQDVIFGLKVLGRELSWDKTFISHDLYVILNEIVYDGSFISSGLKSFCTAGDIELKEVMSGPDYEQLFFGKMRGAHGVGAPIDLCHYAYIFETLIGHYKLSLRPPCQSKTQNLDYRLFCITPVALGGAGLRGMAQMCCNEVANTTKEGIGNLMRLGLESRPMMHCVSNIVNQPLEPLSPVDFMREPEQFHVYGPRLKTQRLAAEVRKHLRYLAANDLSRSYVELDEVGLDTLRGMGLALMALGDVSSEEVRLFYSSTPVAFIDEFIQKLASSTTLSEILGRHVIASLRRRCRLDMDETLKAFHNRCQSQTAIHEIHTTPGILIKMRDLIE